MYHNIVKRMEMQKQRFLKASDWAAIFIEHYNKYQANIIFVYNSNLFLIPLCHQ
ncbi:hypothetical protein PITCH_A1380048 [uncultured Desulfobacterium sp.]|uniref:Uncharacterized protein n=1 Tax=uncultured Desulfobacterium sp. TaxID=201089 RepID=A0A445MSQ5_9BACT|nr:hypothetical protein PITCH_A1380048 [uncultured Desulfobacterium sp.]